MNTMKSQIARAFIGQVSSIDQCHSASLLDHEKSCRILISVIIWRDLCFASNINWSISRERYREYSHCRPIQHLFMQALVEGRKATLWWVFLSCFKASTNKIYIRRECKYISNILQFIILSTKIQKIPTRHNADLEQIVCTRIT